MSSSGNKAWMNKHRLSPEYLEGIVNFLEFTKKHGGGFKHFPCPCVKCRNGSGMITLNMIHEHLLINGIDESYTHWILHGERVAVASEKTTKSNPNEQPNNMYPRMEELINDAFGRIGENVDALMDDLRRNRDIHEGSQEFQGEDEERRYKSLFDDARQSLYPSCPRELTKLSATVELYSLKAQTGWSDNSLNDLLQLVKKWLPAGNTLPVDQSHPCYELIQQMGLIGSRPFKSASGSVSSVPQSPIGVLDAAACLSYKNDEITVRPCTNSHTSPEPIPKRRKIGQTI